MGADVMETEQCDLGETLNALGDSDPDNHACTSTCQVSDKNRWRCTWTEVGSTDVWESYCEYLRGNQKVDIEEWDGQYLLQGTNTPGYPDGSETFTAMSDPEECDIGDLNWDGENSSGYVNTNGSWDADPKTNANMLLGCTIDCNVETGFKCPAAATTAANDDWALNTCTDRCGDGLYDGIYTEINRNTDYPTGEVSAANYADYPAGFSAYIGLDYSARILPEQCDTKFVMDGDYDHGCTELCQI